MERALLRRDPTIKAYNMFDFKNSADYLSTAQQLSRNSNDKLKLGQAQLMLANSAGHPNKKVFCDFLNSLDNQTIWVSYDTKTTQYNIDSTAYHSETNKPYPVCNSYISDSLLIPQLKKCTRWYFHDFYDKLTDMASDLFKETYANDNDTLSEFFNAAEDEDIDELFEWKHIEIYEHISNKANQCVETTDMKKIIDNFSEYVNDLASDYNEGEACENINEIFFNTIVDTVEVLFNLAGVEMHQDARKFGKVDAITLDTKKMFSDHLADLKYLFFYKLLHNQPKSTLDRFPISKQETYKYAEGDRVQVNGWTASSAATGTIKGTARTYHQRLYKEVNGYYITFDAGQKNPLAFNCIPEAYIQPLTP
jgi:hypothetical protein